MTKLALKIFLILCASSILAQAQNSDPDFQKEEHFHNIYKKYNQHPTSSEAWSQALANRKPGVYTVQPKDTLWDVSQTFFGDANYWPKIWSYNTEGILNPHEINPNQAIRFYAGTFEEAPTVGLAAKDAAAEALPDQVIEKREDGTVEAVKIPPPLKPIRPLVKKLPPSIPLYRLGGVNTPPVEFKAYKLPTPPLPQKYLSFYATDRDVTAVGEVVETEVDGTQSVSEFQYITVRLSNGSDKRLVAYDDSHKITDPVGGSSATLVEIQGEIEILEKVHESENIFRAKVLKSLDLIMAGAKLMPGRLQMFEVRSETPTTSVQARIIGGEYHKYQQLFGDNDFVVLSAGAKEGLQEGSTLSVYMNEKARRPGTQSVVNDRVIGQVKVVKLADHFATAFVLKAQNEMVIGDYVGGTTPAATASSSDDFSGLDEEAADPALSPEPESSDEDLQL